MKRKTLLFMMLMAMFSPLALNAQGTFGTFTTGEDVSRWITLDDPQTAMSSGQDEVASDLLTMGSDFSFPFGNGIYTQFWVNSNGMFSFSTNPFGNEMLWYNRCFPKICGVSADLSTGNSGYIKYQLTGTAPNRVFVCEFVMDPKVQQSSYSDVRWQIQLHEAGSKVVIIYGTAPYSNPQHYQSGLSLSANDSWLLNNQTHAATHYTSINNTDRLIGWHGGGRYYEFTPPACYNSPTGLAVVENSLTTRGVTMQWDAEVDDVFDYAIELGTNIAPQNVTYAGSITATATTCSKTWDNLVPNSDYTVFIRRSCGDYGQPATMVIHTEAACASPTNLTATANRKTAILTWEGSADSYQIAWSLDPDANPDENIDPVFQISGTSGSKEFTTIDTRYYFWVRAYKSGDGYSLWEPIDTYIGYCRPNPWTMDGSGIYQFAFLGTKEMYNHDRPTAFPYYGYYIDKICEMNETATVSILYETGYGYKTYIWVDLDNSLTFEDSEILYVGTSAEGASVFLNASITLPGGTPPGDYRMRIGGARAGYISGMDYAGDPCYNERLAIFEDYTLRVHAVSCPRPYALTTTNLTLNSATLNWESDAESFDVQYRTTHVETDFSEGFENGLPSNWSTIHNGSNPNDSWIPNDNSSYAHSGTGCMYSFSNNPDEWLISPQVPLHGTLKFYLRAANEEHFAVYVSTGTTSIDDFVMVGEERVVDPFQNYNEITVDLNSFNGAMGYVAIRHFNSAGLYALILDDFSIYYYQEYGPWIETTSETNSLDLTDLPRNTGYEFQVKAHCDGNETSIWSDIATFTTPDYCSAPYYLTAEAVGNTVVLGWTGYSDTYNVRYRHFTNDPYNELATVILTAGPPFYDYAGGFQMLIDADANANEEYDLFTMGYDGWFEYKIPVDADKYYWTSHMVSNGSVAIQIPAGTYDWVIVNPNPRYEKVTYIGDEGNVGSRQSDYVFEAGKVYEFEVKLYGRLSGADVTITEQTSDWTLVEEVPNPCTLTDLIAGTRYQFQVQGVNCDGNGGNTEWSEIGTFTTEYLGYELHILGYEEAFADPNGGYYLIASPVTVNPANAIDFYTQQSMIEGNFDLYYFDQSLNREWVNYKEAEGNHNPGFNLEPGKGYLYAHDTSREFFFTGTPYSGSGVINLKYDSNAAEFAGCNLLGNPYNHQVSVDKAFYVMNEEGTEIISADENMPIEPMQGFFVVATEAGQKVTFSKYEAPYVPLDPVPLDKLVMNLTNKRGATIDRAIVRFDGGHQLPKFQLNKNHTKVFIPQEGKDYAIVNASEMGEMPVSFKAEKNGTYTLSVNAEEVSFAYLHLIDNMNGNDVDLLANPSYSFNAKSTDYESRFKLVFATGNASDDNFAFYSNGSFVINNEGNATLQVIDVMGRILSSETVNGSVSKTINATPGVYMLRLINGENVKVQKIVVR